MTQFLPANLLALFTARDPIPYLQPPDKLPHEKKSKGYIGVGAFLDQFEVIYTFYFRNSLLYEIKNLHRIQKILHRRRELRQKKNASRGDGKKKQNKLHINWKEK